MSKQENISKQIQQYLDGDLDAPAMHRLEREALNDPFLADALDGYVQAGSNQQASLDEINARLQNRTDEKIKRIILWKWLSVAATVIIVLTAGGLWLANYKTIEPRQPRRAMADKTKVDKSDTILVQHVPALQQENEIISAPPVEEPERIAALRKPRHSIQSDVNAEIRIDEPAGNVQSDRADTIALEDRIADGYLLAKADNLPPVASPITAKSITVENSLQGRVAGLSMENRKKRTTRIIEGRVIDQSGPLPGANVELKGSDIATVTDIRGFFSLPVIPNESELEIDYIGYLKQKVKVKDKDSLVIAMQPSKQSLNEVVVVGYGNASNKVKSIAAHPVTGWDEYKKYLEANAISPDGGKGKVKLSFMVNADNTLSDFKILQSISTQTDAKAIELIKTGSAWMHNTNGEPQKVKITIKFTPKD